MGGGLRVQRGFAPFLAAALLLSDGAGQGGLFDGRSVAGAIDVHFYGKLAAGRHEARSKAGDWQIR
jgi:hypothetical protein